MKHLFKKYLEVSIFTAVFCVIGLAGSVQVDRLTLKDGSIYSILTIIYIGVASIIYIFLGKEKDHGIF